MDVMLAISLAQAAVTMAPQIKQLFSGGVAQVTPEKVTSLLPAIAPVLGQFGSLLSTDRGAPHSAIGAVAAFAPPDQVKGMQVMLNNYLKKSGGFAPLALDGKMGKNTVAAIMLAQTKAGVPVDGLFGPNTFEAISHSQGK